MPWAGNIAKTMTSNGKQFTVTHEMLTAVARVSWRWPDVVARISFVFIKRLPAQWRKFNGLQICLEKKFLALLLVKIPKIRSWWQKLPWLHLEPSVKKNILIRLRRKLLTRFPEQEELNELLVDFYLNARKKSRGHYKKSALSSIWFGLQWHFMLKWEFNIISDPLFKQSNLWSRCGWT